MHGDMAACVVCGLLYCVVVTDLIVGQRCGRVHVFPMNSMRDLHSYLLYILTYLLTTPLQLVTPLVEDVQCSLS